MKRRFAIHAAGIAASVFLSSVAFGQADWTLKFPAHVPPARTSPAMTTFGTSSDGISGDEVIMFGGRGADSAILGDTWRWDGSDWHQITTFGSFNITPPARVRASMALMPAGCCISNAVLFGGTTGSAILGDTWILTRSVQFIRTLSGFISTFAYQWRLLSLSNAPTPRWGAAMSYDATSKKVILSGGFGSPTTGATPTVLNDTWTFDPATFTWSQLPAFSLEPPARIDSAMATCASPSSVGTVPGPILLFGGEEGLNGPLLGDSWEFHPSSFTLGWAGVSPSTHPSARSDPGMAYYPVSKQDVLYGGDLGVFLGNFSTETWNGSCSSSIWAQAFPAHNPGKVIDFGMATGPGGFTAVLFGGVSVNAFSQLVVRNTTFTWGRRVACLPLDDAPLRVGSEVACQFDLEPGIQFGGWIANGFAPPSRDQLKPVFHTEAPGPASITASWTDAQGPHSQSFNYTVVRP